MQSDDEKESKVIKQFSRFAHEYNNYNTIQVKVAKVLVDSIAIKDVEYIIDIGCGSGEIYKNVVNNYFSFDKFIGLDSSKEMLTLHPSNENIDKCCLNFDEIRTETLPSFENKSTLLISSSAIQWSKNLDNLMRELSSISDDAYFAIFTDNTFKTLHQIANIDSPIYSEDILKSAIDKYYNATYKLHSYQLKFESVRDMFRYIKKSGVSGGEKQLSYKQIKQLMDTYPLNYLEFEVLFVEATPLT
ncbi:MAG: methyltransferase domain-containing protein [Sulfurovum sp.]|nr:methyltransferase domain-containing protein [Sulfurovum sp.]